MTELYEMLFSLIPTMSDFIQGLFFWHNELSWKHNRLIIKWFFLYLNMTNGATKLQTFIIKHSFLKEETDLVSTGHEIVCISLNKHQIWSWFDCFNYFWMDMDLQGTFSSYDRVCNYIYLHLYPETFGCMWELNRRRMVIMALLWMLADDAFWVFTCTLSCSSWSVEKCVLQCSGHPSAQWSHSYGPVKHHTPLETEGHPAPDSPHPGTAQSIHITNIFKCDQDININCCFWHHKKVEKVPLPGWKTAFASYVLADQLVWADLSWFWSWGSLLGRTSTWPA